MKISGKEVKGLNSDYIVFSRGTDFIQIKAQAVRDFNAFDKLVPSPIPPKVSKPGGIFELDFKDTKYTSALLKYAEARTDYLVIYSLMDIEWDTVKLDDPTTWKNWRADLQAADFTETELIHIMRLVAKVNSMTEETLDRARSDFLLQARRSEVLSSLVEGLGSTSSGGPVNASV